MIHDSGARDGPRSQAPPAVPERRARRLRSLPHPLGRDGTTASGCSTPAPPTDKRRQPQRDDGRAPRRGRRRWSQRGSSPRYWAHEPVPVADLLVVVDGTDVDRQLLYDVLALRSAVFVVEQACAYQDIDGLDLVDGTVHVLGRDGDGLAAYARLLAPDAQHATARIGRVIVATQARGRRLAHELMARAVEVCEARWPGPIELGAQAHLTGFYRSLGFEPVGEPYDEDGILHQWTEHELFGDVGIGAAACDEAQYVELALGQGGRALGRRSVCRGRGVAAGEEEVHGLGERGGVPAPREVVLAGELEEAGAGHPLGEVATERERDWHGRRAGAAPASGSARRRGR